MGAIDAFDVLMYVFDTWGDQPQSFPMDSDSLGRELEKAGFPAPEIDKALSWLSTLDDETACAVGDVDQCTSLRIFAPEEMSRLSAEARGYIRFLDASGVWAPSQREQVLDRVMTLDAGVVDVERLQWIALMAFNDRPEHAEARMWIEDMVYNHAPDLVH